jgi:hypothetical protein
MPKVFKNKARRKENDTYDKGRSPHFFIVVRVAAATCATARAGVVVMTAVRPFLMRTATAILLRSVRMRATAVVPAVRPAFDLIYRPIVRLRRGRNATSYV